MWTRTARAPTLLHTFLADLAQAGRAIGWLLQTSPLAFGLVLVVLANLA